MKQRRKPQQFLRKHSLSLAALGVVVLLFALYRGSNPATHIGSFFGNAIADWTGVFVTVVMTKYLYEKGSAESKQPKGKVPSVAVVPTRALADPGSCDYRHRLGAGIQGHGPREQVGTSRQQHCFGVDTDSRARPDDQAPDGGHL